MRMPLNFQRAVLVVMVTLRVVFVSMVTMRLFMDESAQAEGPRLWMKVRRHLKGAAAC